ncbi:hypothetical protein VTI28DRAFT_4483 [Corynascus sepedonium]
MALRSASPIHFAEVSASQNRLALNVPKTSSTPNAPMERRGEMPSSTSKTASCTSTAPRTRSKSSSSTGVTQYFNKGEPGLGPHFEVKGWAVDENDDLIFNVAGLLACPSTTDSSWYIWVDAGVTKPVG